MAEISHPISRERINGDALTPGTELQPDDVYDSTSGRWTKCPSPGGKVPEGDHVMWVRPHGEAENTSGSN